MDAATYMTAAIEDAKAREAKIYATEKRIFAGHAYGTTETPLGKLNVTFVVAQGRTTYRPEHMRQCWELNGKRIAREKLVAAFRNAEKVAAA